MALAASPAVATPDVIAPARDDAARAAARLKGDIAAVRARWQALRMSPDGRLCRAHAAATDQVEHSLEALERAFEALGADDGEDATARRAAMAGVVECRHQRRLATDHARRVETVCAALPASAPDARPSSVRSNPPEPVPCRESARVHLGDGVLFWVGTEGSDWSRPGGGRRALRMLHRVVETLPEIVVLRLHGRRLPDAGLRASIGVETGSAIAAAIPNVRAVVVTGADDPMPEAALNFGVARAFVAPTGPEPCRARAPESWWYAEGTAVLSFGRRGTLTRPGAVEWTWAPHADRELSAADRVRGPSAMFSAGERALMGLRTGESPSTVASGAIRGLSDVPPTGEGVGRGRTVCEARPGPGMEEARRAGLGPSLLAVVVSAEELTATDRRDHEDWWRSYTSPDHDVHPESLNFFEAAAGLARPQVIEPVLRKGACDLLDADLP
jgi:hypothetical protein